MIESLGTLNLNIARLVHQVEILHQQIEFSDLYPSHKKKLEMNALILQSQLDELLKRKQLIASRTTTREH